MEINQLRDELDAAVTGQDFSKAAEIKDKVEALDEQKKQLLAQSQPHSQEIKTVKVSCLL